VDGFCFAPVHTIDDTLADAGLDAADVLFAVPLRGLEVAMAQRACAARVLARLGLASRYFPFPPWLDPARQPVITQADLDATIVGTSLPLPVPRAGNRVEEIGRRIVVTVAKATADEVAGAMCTGQVSVASTTMGVGSAAAYVFSAGAPRPQVITTSVAKDGSGKAPSGTSAAFVTLLKHAGGAVCRIIEDGRACKFVLYSH
jgi:hypothetical protein